MRLRSLLFVPAHVDRFVARAHERGADAVILDLEDAVPAEEKPAARAALPAAIATVARGAAPMVRANAGLLDLARDLEAAVHPGLAAIVLPKTEEPALVRATAEAIADLEAARRIAPGTVRLILQVETPAALFALPAIAASHPRVAAITLGPEDFTAAMGASTDDAALLGPNLAVVAAARAAGIVPLGFVGSIAGFEDLEDYARRIAAARRLGFRGAMAIHPSQVPVLNAGFAPDPAEVAWARRVIAGDAAARAEGRGAFRLDGRMVDPPVVRRAAEILVLAGEA